MRLSVIIPVHNRQKLAERALRSALSQDVHGMEVLVVDDCSEPPFQLPGDLASDRRVSVLRNEANLGAGGARNVGVTAAQGEWIAFLDSDDYWLPDTLAPRLALAERQFAASGNSLAAYAAGFVLLRQSSGQGETRIPAGSADLKDFLSGCWFSPGSTALLRREVFAQIGPHDPALRRFEDFDWFIRFALAGGRLEIWPHVAAIVEVGGKTSAQAGTAVISLLRAKYVASGGSHRLPPETINQIEACFDFELASCLAAEKRWLPSVFYLIRSFWRVPRNTLYVRRLWKQA